MISHPEDITKNKSHSFESIANSFNCVSKGIGFDIFVGFEFVFLFSFGFGIFVLQVLVGFGLFFEVVLEQFNAMSVVINSFDFLLGHVQHQLQ